MAAGIFDPIMCEALSNCWRRVKYHGSETGKLSDDDAMRRVAECVHPAFVPCIALPPPALSTRNEWGHQTIKDLKILARVL